MTLLVAADNLNVVNPAVAAALKNLEAGPLQELARRLEGAGAKVLDLNPGYLSARHEDRMVFLVEAVQEVSRLRLMLDSPNPKVLARGLINQLDLAPVQAYVHYALSQPVSLVVVGCDSPEHVGERAQAAREFQPMSPEDQRRLEGAVTPFAKGLMYYKP